MLISPSRVPNELDDSGEVCREYTLWNEEERGRWREGGLSTARKGVGKPLRAVRWQGFDPPARVKPRFQSWRGATFVSWHAVDNEDGRKFGSGPVPLRSPVSACKINEFDRVWGKVGSEAREATVRLTREGSRVAAVVHTGSHVRDPNNLVASNRTRPLIHGIWIRLSLTRH